jgi:hypothetical protein
MTDHDELVAKAVRLLYPFADRDDRTAVASILSTLIAEAEERGKWVPCPECVVGIGCATCGELDTMARGRIRREYRGLLDFLEWAKAQHNHNPKPWNGGAGPVIDYIAEKYGKGEKT